MSGIAGIIHFDSAPIEPDLIKKMTASMSHRGPDGIQHWQKGPIALGQCMLQTTPESLDEVQPWMNEDESLILVMDGRVDNWIELRKDLLSLGVTLRNRSDAELVLRAYEQWGEKCSSHIDGDYAIVIWNARKQLAFCIRDRLGNKPFYYHWNGKTLVFASELRAILTAPWVEQNQNGGMLVEFIAGEWHSRSETLWKDINRLVAAHQMSVGKSDLRILEYWSPDLHQILPYKKEQEYFDHYRELLLDCVRRMSRSHRPLSIEVSGGLDSSAIFSIAQQLKQKSELLAEKIEGYSLRFENNGPENELEYSRDLARHFSVDINEVPASLLPFSWFENRACEYKDFPGFPNAAMFDGIRRVSAARGSRVTLTGEGGDQWLQGGEQSYYREELSNRNWSALLHCLHADIVGKGAGKTAHGFLRYGCFPMLPESLQKFLMKIRHGGKQNISAGKFWLSESAQTILEERRTKHLISSEMSVRNFGQIELMNTLQNAFTDLVMDNAERLASYHGTELRYPFRSPQFVQFAFSFPERFRLRGGRTKYIHIKAMRGVMPPKVLNRNTKAEFTVSFRPKLLELTCQFKSEIVAEISTPVMNNSEQLLDRSGLNRLYQAFLTENQVGWPLWPLWSIWLYRRLDGTSCNNHSMDVKKKCDIMPR